MDTTKPIEKKEKKKRQIPLTLNEAKSVFSNKFLVNVNKMNMTTPSTLDPHLQLVYFLYQEAIKHVFANGEFCSALSVVKPYYNGIGANMYYENENIKFLVKQTLQGHYNENDLDKYVKTVLALTELINLNILNYSVYVDPLKFGKHKLFSVIENVIFTQIMPTELNKCELEFKDTMKTGIQNMKMNIIKKKELKKNETPSQ